MIRVREKRKVARREFPGFISAYSGDDQDELLRSIQASPSGTPNVDIYVTRYGSAAPGHTLILEAKHSDDPVSGLTGVTFHNLSLDDLSHSLWTTYIDPFRLPASTAAEDPAQRDEAQSTLDNLVLADVERLLVSAASQLTAEDQEQEHDALRRELGLFVARHGIAGIRAVGTAIIGRPLDIEVASALLRLLGEITDQRTEGSRREVLAAALESRDAGLRYAAASALGSMGDAQARDALQKRLAWEKNTSVRRVIEAELR